MIDEEGNRRKRKPPKPKPIKCYTWPVKHLERDIDDQFLYSIDWYDKKFSEDDNEKRQYIMEYGRRHNTFLYKIFKVYFFYFKSRKLGNTVSRQIYVHSGAREQFPMSDKWHSINHIELTN